MASPPNLQIISCNLTSNLHIITYWIVPIVIYLRSPLPIARGSLQQKAALQFFLSLESICYIIYNMTTATPRSTTALPLCQMSEPRQLGHQLNMHAQLLRGPNDGRWECTTTSDDESLF